MPEASHRAEFSESPELFAQVDVAVATATAAKVKVCGITNLEDAELAVKLGAWTLGMIFYEGSPRRCSLGEAQRIVARLRRKVELCGVFVNAPLEQVVRTTEELGLTMLQFHGDEGPSFCAEATRRNGARVIKAAQVSGPGDVRDLERFHVDFHLLDAGARRSSIGSPQREALRGGTGETFDWNLLAARRSRIPLILSGGLNAENVTAAIAVGCPYAVDTASGTEAAPGHKDPQKLRAFFDATAQAARAAGQQLARDRSTTGRPADPALRAVRPPAATRSGGLGRAVRPGRPA